MLLVFIRPFISSFFFLYSFQTLNFFTLFSGTVRHRRLKHGTYVDSGQMHRVYRNQAAGAYLSLYFFIFLSLQFSNIKLFSSHFSQQLWGLEDWNVLHLWTVGRCIVYTGIMLLVFIRPFISSFFFLYNFQTLKFFTLFSGTVRHRRLKHGTHVDSWHLYRVYRNQPAAAYSSLYIFIFLSLQFSNI